MNWDNPKTKDLFEAILRLKSVAEAKRFFRDLLTEQEIIEFGKRWQAAQMLAKKASYSEIVEKTGLSSTTVARVSKWLNKGTGGYKLMLKRLNSHHHAAFPNGKGLR
ncbi:MAG: YerC/YecD family TrpR-related protein [bacterium]|nr:YerC/YecD family TrpR-related protein [bacterium]